MYPNQPVTRLVRPPKSLTHNPLNATASSFAPKRRRKWVQASRMRSLGVVRLAGTKVCARAPWRPESGAHQPREPNCGGGCGGRTRIGSGGKKLGIPSTTLQRLLPDTRGRFCQRRLGGGGPERHKKLTCQVQGSTRDREVGEQAHDGPRCEHDEYSLAGSREGRRAKQGPSAADMIDRYPRSHLVPDESGGLGRRELHVVGVDAVRNIR